MNKEIQELKNSIEKTVIQEIPAEKLEWGKLAEPTEWEEAKEWCAEQGEGWRLPTDIELLRAYHEKVPGFGTGYRWSATEYSETNARIVGFSCGITYHTYKTNSYAVRCVRNI